MCRPCRDFYHRKLDRNIWTFLENIGKHGFLLKNMLFLQKPRNSSGRLGVVLYCILYRIHYGSLRNFKFSPKRGGRPAFQDGKMAPFPSHGALLHEKPFLVLEKSSDFTNLFNLYPSGYPAAGSKIPFIWRAVKGFFHKYMHGGIMRQCFDYTPFPIFSKP